MKVKGRQEKTPWKTTKIFILLVETFTVKISLSHAKRNIHMKMKDHWENPLENN